MSRHIVCDPRIHGSEDGDPLDALCGAVVRFGNYFDTYVLSEVGAHCPECLKKWEILARESRPEA